MTDTEEIVIDYLPRFPQDILHDVLDNVRFFVLVAHRRMGKTVFIVNQIIKKALENPLPSPRYAYIAPFLKQAKLISWDYFKRFSREVPGTKINESELTVTLPNGAKIYIFGADNPDALRGTYLDGCAIDEYAQAKPGLFEEIIRPTLVDREGWCIFSGTPKGQNQFFDVYNQAKKLEAEGNTDWGCATYRADETDVIPQSELDQIKAVTAEATYNQEYLCDFSAASDNVLIPIDLVSNACSKHYSDGDVRFSSTIMGVDVARFGDDASTIIWRTGLQCYEPRVFHKIDNMTLVGEVSKLYNEMKPDALFIDAGRGEGVIDRLRQLNYPVIEVNFGGKSVNPHYANKRTEMWHGIKDWLDAGGALPQTPELKADLVTPTYDFDAQNRMRLESKDKIKERLGRSPDIADALALTFAQTVFKQDDRERVLPRKAIV